MVFQIIGPASEQLRTPHSRDFIGRESLLNRQLNCCLFHQLQVSGLQNSRCSSNLDGLAFAPQSCL